MSAYALKVVSGDWDIEMPLPFSKAEYERALETIESGMRVVIYQTGNINGIVSEAQVSQPFIHIKEWPEQNLGRLDKLNPETEYLLPVQILYRRHGSEAIMPREVVAERLGEPSFPQPEHEWMIIDDDVYHALVKEFS